MNIALIHIVILYFSSLLITANKIYPSFNIHKRITRQLLSHIIYDKVFQSAHEKYILMNYTQCKFKSTDELWEYQDPYPYLSVYNEDLNVCKTNPYILIIFPTRYNDFELRNFYRNSFPQNNSVKNVIINRLFLIAVNDSNREEWSTLINERNKYGDIIISRTPEGNIHLAKLMWTAYYWISQHCQKVRYVVKIDTDALLFLPNLIEFIFQLPEKRAYSGFIWPFGHPYTKLHHINNNHRKWVFPRDYLFPRSHQAFVSGITEIYSSDIIPILAVGAYYQEIFMTAGEDIMAATILSKVGIFPYISQSKYKFVPVSNMRYNGTRDIVIWHSTIYKNFSILYEDFNQILNTLFDQDD